MHLDNREQTEPEKALFFSFFSIPKPKGLNDLAVKIGKGQPGIKIYTRFVELAHQMLHTKFQGNQLNISGEEYCFTILSYMGIAVIFDMQPGPNIQNYPPSAWRLHMEFNLNWLGNLRRSLEMLTDDYIVTFGQGH